MNEALGELVAVSISRIEALQLQPGDVLVLTAEKRLSDEEIDNVQKNVRSLFPGHQVAVLDGGLKLSVVHREVDGE